MRRDGMRNGRPKATARTATGSHATLGRDKILLVTWKPFASRSPISNFPQHRKSSMAKKNDLGFSKEESEHLLVRADLLIHVQKAITSRRLKQAEAAKVFRVTQSRVSDLLRGRIDLFSTDALIPAGPQVAPSAQTRDRSFTATTLACNQAAPLLRSGGLLQEGGGFENRGFARAPRLDVDRRLTSRDRTCRMVLYESYPRHRRHRERRSPGCRSTGGNGSAVPRHDPQPGCGRFAATGRGGARGSHGSRDAGSLPARY